MIPHKLRVCNFMCYREEQVLDFSGIHLACLTGDNGHGKSALLDAVTWAIWGKARARRDDELIALGETEMWVDFEFGLGPQRHRIWRQRSKKGRGQSDLHFYVWNAPAGEWQLLDEGGLHERQAQIIRTLRMEYDTFVNSAFLLQNRADSFTVKTPAERKQILADILGLGRYDAYEKQAKDEVGRRRARVEVIEGQVAGIDGDLAQRGEHEASLAAARAALGAAVAQVRAAEADQAERRSELQALRMQVDRLADLRSRMARAERDLDEARVQRDQAQVRLDGIESVLAEREEIEAGWRELERLRAEDAAWNASLLARTPIEEQVRGVERALEAAAGDIRAELRSAEERGAELERRVAAGEAGARTLAEVQAVTARMEAQQARRDALIAEARELGEKIAGLQSEMGHVRSGGQACNERAEMLASVEAAACPLCRQSLTPAHRDRMLAELAAEREALSARLQDMQAELKRLTERQEAIAAEDAELARQLHDREARLRQAAQAEKAVEEGESAAEARAGLEETRARLAAQLTAGDYAEAERAQLAALQAELAQVGYDQEAHAAVGARLKDLQAFDARYQRRLLPALENADGARAQVQALSAALTRREAELAEDAARRDSLAAAVAGLADVEAALARADAEVEAAVAAERRARQGEGAAMQKLTELDNLDERRTRLMAERDALAAEMALYGELSEAFGKKGVQAMIIENAIPEVEAEANRLLGRMSEGRMTLRLETQREKATGGMAETLDILIADEVGQRAYELFSGGEAFRANLALRIAISKLLARRAGAQLQMLVIDEGFGSQDAAGRSLVVEAINTIQHDFERILVITHIDELRDLFPARIDVVKTATGSRVAIA